MHDGSVHKELFPDIKNVLSISELDFAGDELVGELEWGVIEGK